MARTLVSSGSKFEHEIGFSRAVKVGQHIAISGTAPIGPKGGTVAVGDVYGQTRRCLQIIEHALWDAGGTIANVTRTRVMLTDISRWEDAARAHSEVFRETRPACTFIEVARFIDPSWLVEIEADGVIG